MFKGTQKGHIEITVLGMDGRACCDRYHCGKHADGSFRSFFSNAWGLNTTIVGMLILAALTGVPNVITSIKLALDGRGTAVMSEALNSNRALTRIGTEKGHRGISQQNSLSDIPLYIIAVSAATAATHQLQALP